MIKQYFYFCVVWWVAVLGIAACTSYHVEQNSNNGDTCKKGIGNYSIFGEHNCSIESDKPKEQKQESVEK